VSDEVSEILSQICQIKAQYNIEVPGSRRRWPKSVRERVVRLRELKLTIKEIADQTGISAHSIVHWGNGRKFSKIAARPEKDLGHFKAVQVIDVPSSAVPQLAEPQYFAQSGDHKSATVTVTLPHGISLEGASAQFVVQLLRCLECKS
jgi:transposase-like protein